MFWLRQSHQQILILFAHCIQLRTNEQHKIVTENTRSSLKKEKIRKRGIIIPSGNDGFPLFAKKKMAKQKHANLL